MTLCRIVCIRDYYRRMWLSTDGVTRFASLCFRTFPLPVRNNNLTPVEATEKVSALCCHDKYISTYMHVCVDKNETKFFNIKYYRLKLCLQKKSCARWLNGFRRLTLKWKENYQLLGPFVFAIYLIFCSIFMSSSHTYLLLCFFLLHMYISLSLVN